MFDRSKIQYKIDTLAKFYGMDNETKLILSQFADDIDENLMDLIDLRYHDVDNFVAILKLQRKLTEMLTMTLLSSKYDLEYYRIISQWAEDEGFIPKRNDKKMKDDFLEYAKVMPDGLSKDTFIKLIESIDE